MRALIACAWTFQAAHATTNALPSRRVGICGVAVGQKGRHTSTRRHFGESPNTPKCHQCAPEWGRPKVAGASRRFVCPARKQMQTNTQVTQTNLYSFRFIHKEWRRAMCASPVSRLCRANRKLISPRNIQSVRLRRFGDARDFRCKAI